MSRQEKMEDEEDVVMLSLKKRFRKFLLEYQPMPNSEHYYRKLILNNHRNRKQTLKVNLGHMSKFDNELVKQFIIKPERCLENFESIVQEVLEELIKKNKETSDKVKKEASLFVLPGSNELSSPVDENTQIIFAWKRHSRSMSLRKLQAKHVNQLVFISGIITKASRFQHQITRATFECNTCKTTQVIYVKPQESVILAPGKCIQENLEDKAKRCGGRYTIQMRTVKLKDIQFLKIQELPENVPTGEIPQNLTLVVEKHFVEKVPPGTRVDVIGIFSAGLYKLSIPYLRVIGLEKQLKYSNIMDKNVIPVFSDEEENEFLKLSRRKDIYKIIARSIDPGIFGHVDIKKSIACQLFGGTPRKFKDGNRRRGDIHILLLGDPSTAKSQLLKYAKQVSPIGVYTSGKGSSAAGLTASVVKEPRTREFYLEGGSMVLADGGLCCIDEFDKMNERDRVAIHEAMEQQTISIAKAGITTVLNSRTAVLAAANPIGGKYVDFQSTEEQIDFQTTILSRFDFIYIVQDKLSSTQDRHIADHVKKVMYTESAHRIRRGNRDQKTIMSSQSIRGLRMLDDDDDDDDDDDSMDKMIDEEGDVNKKSKSSKTKSRRRKKREIEVSKEEEKMKQDEKYTIPAEHLTSYISYCRRKCFPQLDQEAINFIVNFYVQERKKRRGYIPITVRQIEALIRITESIAKMYLQDVATKPFAEEAVRLFKASTVKAIRSGEAGTDLLLTSKGDVDLEKIQEAIRNRVGIKSTVRIDWLQKHLEENESSIKSKISLLEKAIYIMVKKGELDYRHKRMSVHRRK